MKVKLIISVLAAVVMAMFFVPSVQAQVFVTLNSPTGQPGSTVSVFGGLQNLSPTDVYDLLGDSITLDDSSQLLITDNFNNTPLNLGTAGSGSDSYFGDLLDVAIDPSTPYNTYYGTYTLFLNDESSSVQSQVEQNFTVTVAPTPAPESSSVVVFAIMMGLGVVAMTFLTRRNRKAA